MSVDGVETGDRPAPWSRLDRRGALPLAGLVLALFALQLWYHASHTSPTLDEPYHLLAGYRYWECGDFGINAEHPPLSKLVATLPIRSWPLVGPSWPCGSRVTPLDVGFQAGTRFVLDNGIGRVVLPARLASSVVSLALAAFVALAALEMFGVAEALVALALFAFEPTLVAHGSLVTSDMLLAGGVFAAAVLLYRATVLTTVPRLAAAGLALGVALAAKHSALAAVPVLCVLPVLDMARAGRGGSTKGAGVSRDLARGAVTGVVTVLVGLAVLWACYGFRYAALPGGVADGTTVATILASTPHPEASSSALGLIAVAAERSHAVPQAYAWGLAYVAGYRERPTYLLGAHFPTGQWFYFPMAFAIKTSIPLLVLLVLALVTTRDLARRRPREVLFLLVPSLAFFAVSMTSSLNIGIRHVLPVYPFFIVLAAAGACHWARRSRAAAWGVAALLAFHAVTAARVAPDDLAFANDLWGGTDRAYRLLHDSNVDWGQNLDLVSAYLDRQGPGDVWFACYGNGELARAIVPRCRQLPAPGWTNGDDVVEAVPRVLDGTVLLSASVLADAAGGIYAPITSSAPTDVIGGGVLVYRGRFDVPLVAAASHLDRCDQLTRLGRFDEAIEDARAAVDLAPDDAWARLALGTSLARAGRLDAARAELRAVAAAGAAQPAPYGEAGERATRLLAELP